MSMTPTRWCWQLVIQSSSFWVSPPSMKKPAEFWGGWEGQGLLETNEKVEGLSELSAPDLLIELLQKSPVKVVVAPVGGLSNIAAALKKDPSIRNKIDRLVIMGGSIFPIVIDGVTIPARAETNLHNDPNAAAEVLRSGIPIRLVPGEVTYKTKLLKGDFKAIQKLETPLARSIAAMTLIWEPHMKKYMAMSKVEKYYDDGHIMLHDPLAVATIVEPKIFKMKTMSIRIEHGSGSIRTVGDSTGGIPMEIVTEADNAALSKLMADVVSNNLRP
jgi:purine nucleosidase